MLKLHIRFVSILLSSGILCACSNMSTASKQAVTFPDRQMAQGKFAHNQPQLHYYVEQLARQLFNTAGDIDSAKSVAVGTILPSSLDNGKSLPSELDIGRQIQESLLTLSTQAGLKVVEFKTMQNIKLSDGQDAMLSRELQYLSQQVANGYFLTGTYTASEDNLIVNLRLIDVSNHQVIAAATDYVPIDILWEKSKVSLKNNQIIRSS